ncbi:MAG: hypothetical protein GY754_39805 [bacterium]|nr:hypothetical protein [bacterium]
MNEDIQNFLNSYVNMIDTYADKVDDNHEKLVAAREYFAKMEALGNSCADISTYMGKVAEDDMMNIMSRLLTELAEAGLAADRASGNLKIPTAKEYGIAYREAYKSIDDKEKFPGTCAVYDRVFELEDESEFAPEFMRKLAEEGLFNKMTTVSLAENSRKIIPDSEKVSQPVMVYHNEQMALMADNAQSAIEVEYESQRLMELNRTELMCDQMLCMDLYYRLGGAIASYLVSPTEDNLHRVENNYRFVAEFFSVDMEELYQIQRVSDLIKQVILPALNDKGQVYTFESFIEEQKMVIKKSIEGKPAEMGPGSRKSIVLWGKKIALDDAFEAFRNPERPEEFLS